MGLLDGKVAFITDPGRGQGRATALKLASEGADIVAFDIANPKAMTTLSYDLASEADLQSTVQDIEVLDRRVVSGIVDIRSLSEVPKVIDAGLQQFGHIDLVYANAGIGSWGVTWELSEEAWHEMIDVNLTGQFNTVRAVLPSMVARGAGGSVVMTSLPDHGQRAAGHQRRHLRAVRPGGGESRSRRRATRVCRAQLAAHPVDRDPGCRRGGALAAVRSRPRSCPA